MMQSVSLGRRSCWSNILETRIQNTAPATSAFYRCCPCLRLNRTQRWTEMMAFWTQASLQRLVLRGHEFLHQSTNRQSQLVFEFDTEHKKTKEYLLKYQKTEETRIFVQIPLQLQKTCSATSPRRFWTPPRESGQAKYNIWAVTV